MEHKGFRTFVSREIMPRTALFMGPMARKKLVKERPQSNTFRIISEQAESSYVPGRKGKPPFTIVEDYNILGQTNDVRPSFEFRHNRPNPREVGFLRQDVRLLNEPVCDVHTKSTQAEQYRWWTHYVPKDTPSVPKHTLDTTIRDHYQYRGSDVSGNTRHSANPNVVPAKGAVPVNMLKKPDGTQRWLNEGISYEHHYNSRLDPSYPIRGKRQGSFVWSEIPPKEVDKLMKHYGLSKNVPATPAKDSDSDKPTSAATEPAAAAAASVQQTQEKDEVAHIERTKVSKVPTLPPISAL